jgi:long-chain acyl-CoA synthetase
MGPPFNSVYEAFAAMARSLGAKAAIRFESGTISYEALLWSIDNTAVRLASLGIPQGEVFAAYSQNRPELITCYYGAAKIGAVFVPINPNMTPTEVEYTLRHSGARLLLYDELVGESARIAGADRMLHPISTLAERANNAAHVVNPPVRPDDDFLIIYTSGSTGTPKAIVLDHAAQINGPRALAEMWNVTENDVTVVALPLGYLYGLSTAAATGLQSGGTVVILRRFHPRDVLDALVQHRATVFHGVPTMYSMMLEYCEQRDLRVDLSGLRALICAGAPLPDGLMRRFHDRFRKPLQNYYAMTECTPVFGKYATDPQPVPKGSVGCLAPGTVVNIRRPDGSECGVGETGELFVRGAATMKRYLNDPVLTEASMRDGLFRSGDIGHCDANDFYYVTDRVKDIIIRGGANISPAEVERVLASHPAVQDACIVGTPDWIFGEVPVAFVVRRPGASVTAEELIAHAETALADFKVPRTIHFDPALPLGKTGKVDKTALKQRLGARSDE